MTFRRPFSPRLISALLALGHITVTVAGSAPALAQDPTPPGLNSGDAALGASYTNTAGVSHSDVVGTGPGYAFGHSHRYLGDTHVGQAAWFAPSPAGDAVRIGFWDTNGSGTDEFTSSSGVQLSHAVVSAVVDGIPFVAGNSRRYLGAAETDSRFGSAFGVAAWIHNALTGETIRLGLVGDGFTKLSGETNDGLQLGARTSSVSALTASGYVQGYTLDYSPATTGTGQALWVGRVDDLDNLTRVGLHDPAGTPEEELEFTEADGTQSAFPQIGPTESGYLAGTSNRRVYSDDWGVGTAAGRAVWVANAATGRTHRVGFTEGFEYTSNVSPYGGQVSQLYTIAGAADLLNEKARVTGYSQRYKDQSGADVGAPTIQLGQAAWIADATKGETTRIGLWDGAAYNQRAGQRAGSQHSVVTGIHAGTDYVWGYSQRYTAAATGNSSANRTAWIHDVRTGAQAAFELGASEPSGLGFSVVGGMTSGGVAYGRYATYEPGSDTRAGDRAFLWSAMLGARTLDDLVGAGRLAEGGWAALRGVDDVEENGPGLLTLTGEAELMGGGTDTYRLTLDLDGGSVPGADEIAAFLDWLGAQGLPATLESYAADADGDGLPALLEFALGEPGGDGRPGGVSLFEAILIDSGGAVYPGIRYTVRRDIGGPGGVTLLVEHAGGDLVFPSAEVLPVHATRDVGGGVDEVELRSAIPLAVEPRQFFRLRATLPE